MSERNPISDRFESHAQASARDPLGHLGHFADEKGVAREGHNTRAVKTLHKAGKKPISFHPGALHEQLGVKQGEKIPAGKMAEARSGKLGGLAAKRANFARNVLTGPKKKLKSYDEGGEVTETGPAMLQQGEQVFPAVKKSLQGIRIAPPPTESTIDSRLDVMKQDALKRLRQQKIAPPPK